MAIPELQKFRAKYPGYDDIDDITLATKLATKYPDAYGDLPSKVKGKTIEISAPTLSEEQMRKNAIANEEWAKKSLAGKAKEYFLGEMPDNPILSKEYLTQNVPRSLVTLPVKAAYGLGKTAYDVTKSITDPAMQAGLYLGNVANAALGGDADYFDKDIAAIEASRKPTSQVMSEALHGTAKTMLAPFGVYGGEEANKAWNDPAMALAGISPTVKLATKVGAKAKMTPEKLDNAISKQYQEAVRPSVSGTAGSYKQFAESNKRAAEGVYDIVKAKDRGALKLGDEMEGEIPTNRLPQTIQEHLQAINQAKTNAFEQYDAMKKAAGENGANIDLTPISNELFKASTDKVLNDLKPQTVQYMRNQAEMLSKRKTYTADEAQQAIATLNTDLKSFYRNPTPDLAGKMVVDASIARHMREALDKAIESEQGPGYQALKNEYGRLAAMEKDAAHRARVVGRAAPVSLIDAMGGYLGSGEMVSGILSMNPALIAKGGTMLALKNYIKKVNSPDHKIKQMYKLADKKYVRPPEETYTPIEKEVLLPPVYPGAGKINTLNLPVGKKNIYPGAGKVNTGNLPVGNDVYYDKYVGANRPIKQ